MNQTLSRLRRLWDAAIVGIAMLLLACGGGSSATSGGSTTPTVLGNYHLTGAVTPVYDPSVMRQGSNYYVFGTDIGAPIGGSLPIACSVDRVEWNTCGFVFNQIPSWVTLRVPGVVGLWAPDISYFNDLYHVYYAGSTFGSNTSVIGLATNTTLDRSKLPMDRSGRGSGIDPPGLPGNWQAIEAPFIVHHGDYYYLFVSFDLCCRGTKSTYKTMISRSHSVTGPYVDADGTPMLEGGGSSLLLGNSRWFGPGGESVLQQIDGDIIVFHAYDGSTGHAYLQISTIAWVDGWPKVALEGGN